MNYSKNVRRLAKEITSHYAKFRKHDYHYDIDISDIADFDLQELAALLIHEDSSLASEATGLDNPAYEKTMLPALTRHLTKPTDKDEQIEFMSAWREGITSYLENIMTELFDHALCDMNDHLRYVSRDQREEDRLWL